MSKYYWLSFADAAKPKGTQFLGALIIEGATLAAAIKAAHIMGLNPGGEIQAQAFETTDPQGKELLEKWKEKLLTKDECWTLDPLMAGHVKALEADINLGRLV